MRRLPLRQRLWLQGLRQRLRLPLRRLRRLWLRRLRLLLVLGTLPHLLVSNTFRLRWQMQLVMAGFGIGPGHCLARAVPRYIAMRCADNAIPPRSR
jgi:hypothetical protein